NEMPLSMRFMHKPSRSKELLEKATDPTRQNSLLNSHLGDSAVVDGPGSPSGPNSPADVTNSPSNDKYKLVRKKSGELVKPSLKDPNATYFNKKRSQSLPTTPTYKQVHFGGDNDVRYFKKKDRPTAISASNSPTLEGAEILVKRINLDSEEETDDDSTDDYYDDEGEDGDELNGHYSKYRHHHRHNNPDEDDEEYNNFNLNSTGSTKYPRAKAIRNIDWQLKLLNFPPLSYDTRIKREVPVFLERLFISVDKKYLLGHIAVKNVAFEKYLTVRYSLDNWMTIIEIPSLYAPDRPDILKKNNYDRFIFQVPLENLFDSFRLSTSSSESSDSSDNNDSNSEKSQEKVYQLCIKYVANNVDFWDNNGFKNYVIKLIKTIKTPGSVASAIKFNPKIQDHAKKPKYSSSYLKRIVSDSQIELKGKKEDPFYVHDNSSSDVNDFVKNNFYMSSPLLSSYNNHASRNIKFNQKHGGTLPNFSSPKPAFSTGNGEVSPDSSPDVIPQKSRDFLNSKSYKELLDNYCFFSSPSTND
ncbi:regulatory subunit for phosphoprotein phosphatase type 1 (PP-1), partial [Scheffersomyces stipitis CBS 6054]